MNLIRIKNSKDFLRSGLIKEITLKNNFKHGWSNKINTKTNEQLIVKTTKILIFTIFIFKHPFTVLLHFLQFIYLLIFEN